MGLSTVRSIYMVATRMSFLLFGLAIWSGVSSANVCTAGINETAPIVEHVEYQIGDIANLGCDVPENLHKSQIMCKSDHNPNIDNFGDKYDRQFRSKKGIYVLTVNNLTTDDFTTYECGYSVNNSYEQVCCFNLQLVELMNGSDVSETIESSFTSTDETETFLDEDYITKESNSDKQIFWCALKKRSTFQDVCGTKSITVFKTVITMNQECKPHVNITADNDLLVTFYFGGERCDVECNFLNDMCIMSDSDQQEFQLLPMLMICGGTVIFIVILMFNAGCCFLIYKTRTRHTSSRHGSVDLSVFQTNRQAEVPGSCNSLEALRVDTRRKHGHRNILEHESIDQLTYNVYDNDTERDLLDIDCEANHNSIQNHSKTFKSPSLQENDTNTSEPCIYQNI